MRYHARLSGTTAITTTTTRPTIITPTTTSTTAVAADLQRNGHHGAERHRGERRAVRLLRERIVKAHDLLHLDPAVDGAAQSARRHEAQLERHRHLARAVRDEEQRRRRAGRRRQRGGGGRGG